MTIGERIKKVRKAKSLTQQVFADNIGIKQNSVALLESGKRSPSDQTIAFICKTYHVNEEWLRTGAGEMFAPEDGSLLKRIASERNLSPRASAFLGAFLSLPDDEQEAFARAIEDAAQKMKDAPRGEPSESRPPAPDISEAEYEKAQAIVDAYRAQKNEYVKKGWPTSTPEEDEAG